MNLTKKKNKILLRNKIAVISISMILIFKKMIISRDLNFYKFAVKRVSCIKLDQIFNKTKKRFIKGAKHIKKK